MGQKFILILFLTTALLLVGSKWVTQANPSADPVIYADSLANGWQDWSWDLPQHDLNSASPVHGGEAAVSVTFTNAWSALYFGRATALDSSGYDTLRFYIHGGSNGGQKISVRVGNSSAWIEQDVSPQAGTWQQVDISIQSLSPAQLTTIWWQDNSGSAQATFYVDDVHLVNAGLPEPTPAPPGSGPLLSVDASANRHAISPYIYGMNFADTNLAEDLQLPVNRWGGNATTRYNWQLDVSNRASDWFFENIPNGNGSGLPGSASSNQFIDEDLQLHTQTIMTLPLIGWTPKDREIRCGFSVSKYGSQQQTDPYRNDCGNGVASNGSDITGNDPIDTSTAIDPEFVQAWIEHLTARYGAASQGGVRFYDLDNEPMLWPDTHRDVHPQPTSYDELRDRTIDYASSVKASDPSAQTLGPAVWGWSAYFYSALDWSSGGSWWNNPLDRLAHGDVPFVEWYLQQMKAYEDAHGQRILNYLDIHYYPQSGVALTGAGDSNQQALRLRSTRSLWDSTYNDESWIGEPVRLIPRMKEWVQTNYPGTKLAITEYNWGALDHINGALAQADVLGIFGREGLDLATLWAPPASSEPGAFAFRMYLNYDGSQGKFGETALQATSGDQEQLSVYAAQRFFDGVLTVMVINKSGQTLSSTLQIQHFDAAGKAQGFRYSPADLGAIVSTDPAIIGPGGLQASYPANSITLWVIPPGEPIDWNPTYLPLIRR